MLKYSKILYNILKITVANRDKCTLLQGEVCCKGYKYTYYRSDF